VRRTGLALAVLATATCGTTPPPAAAPSTSASPVIPAVAGIEAEAVLLRTDEAIGGRFQVRVTATGDEAFTVTAVALDSPGFAALPATTMTTEFEPGWVIDLPTPYGAPDCGAEPLPAAALLTVVRPGGAEEEVRVPLSADVLADVHGEECAELSVLEEVGIRVTGLVEDGDALTGSLILDRRDGEEAVSATRLGRSVLVDVAVDGLPLVLASGEPTVATSITFTPASCDPHVLAETKKPYVFPLTVEVGNRGPVPVDLPLEEPARERLAALVQRVCASTR
jgi:hypothetical protein